MRSQSPFQPRQARPLRTALSATLAAALLLAPLSAEAARSPTGLSVNPDATIAGGIAVKQMAGRGAIDVWCAAGDYAKRRLGAANGTELVLVRPSSGGGSTVTFQVGGQGRGSGTGVSVGTAGESRTVAEAAALCRPAIAKQQPDR
jgi:hypothetical protein